MKQSAGLIVSGFIFFLTLISACQQPNAIHKIEEKSAWQADLLNGYYQNPIIHADYSDPDVIRVGDTYYMTSSSFNHSPGLPLLQSKDMVNWELVGHALPQQVPQSVFAVPQHGKGVWAPCLRFHDNKFWIFYPDPDFGIYVITAEKFSGPWTEPYLLLPGKGLIDPTPLWDDDGKAYLLHAWAKSRAGINNLLTLRQMSPDGKSILDETGKIIIDANKLANYRTLEGPKFYKYNNYYYVFAPAGGVEFGWQSVFRSKNIEGPYENKIVLEQGKTIINGPHQGAWVKTPEGSDWFFHFQDKGAYGRIVHLQPMRWVDDWPVMGNDPDQNGTGEPVLQYKKPHVGFASVKNPATSDEFSDKQLGFQWQWNANWLKEWFSLDERSGYLRLFSVKDESYEKNASLWAVPSLLMQKLPADNFVVDARFDLRNLQEGNIAGLLIYGFDYQWLGIKVTTEGRFLVLNQCMNTEMNCKENTIKQIPLESNSVYLRMKVTAPAEVEFSYSSDNKRFIVMGSGFRASKGRWIGAQMVLFSLGDPASSIDVDYFRVNGL
jgi:beta-xylosidase